MEGRRTEDRAIAPRAPVPSTSNLIFFPCSPRFSKILKMPKYYDSYGGFGLLSRPITANHHQSPPNHLQNTRPITFQSPQRHASSSSRKRSSVSTLHLAAYLVPTLVYGLKRMTKRQRKEKRIIFSFFSLYAFSSPLPFMFTRVSFYFSIVSILLPRPLHFRLPLTPG